MDNQPNASLEPQPLSKKQRRRLARLAERQQSQQGQGMKKGMRRFSGWIAIIAVFGLIVWGIITLASYAPPVTPGVLSTPVSSSDWTKGSSAAPVTLVEYSDFQCPACATYFPIVKKLLEERGSDIYFVYRNYPLRAIHPNGAIAAQAAEAAGLQSKFWEMHDQLFINQTKWSSLSDPSTAFGAYATAIGINVQQFEKDLTSDAVKEAVREDEESGQSSGVNSTPSFFVNGVKLPRNPSSYEEFASIIDVAKQTALNPASSTASTTNATSQ